MSLLAASLGRAVRWPLLLAIGGLAGTLVFAPAQWLATALAAHTEGRIRLVNVQGTLWQGQADLLLTGGAGSADRHALPGGIQWKIRPGWHHGAALHTEWRAPCCAPKPWTAVLAWQPQGGTLQLAAHESTWPAHWLTGLGAPWNTLQPTGQLQLHTDAINVGWAQGQVRFAGAARLHLRDLSSALSAVKPLGTYRLELSTPGPTPTLHLHTVEGALQLSGQGEWLDGRWRFRGVAESPPERIEALSNLLNILGRRDGLRAHLSLG